LHGVSRCPYQSFSNASKAPKCCVVDSNGDPKCPTSFPAGITSSTSFNKTLFRAIGTAVGTEARVMSNAGIASLTFWTPNVSVVPPWPQFYATCSLAPVLRHVSVVPFWPQFYATCSHLLPVCRIRYALLIFWHLQPQHLSSPPTFFPTNFSLIASRRVPPSLLPTQRGSAFAGTYSVTQGGEGGKSAPARIPR